MKDDGVITLEDYNSGEELEFEFLDVITYEDEDYILLYPLSFEDDRVYIFKIVEDALGDDTYVGVSDDDIVQAVFRIYCEKAENEEDG